MIRLSLTFTWPVKKFLNLTLRFNFQRHKSSKYFWFFFQNNFRLGGLFCCLHFLKTLFSKLMPNFGSCVWKSVNVIPKDICLTDFLAMIHVRKTPLLRSRYTICTSSVDPNIDTYLVCSCNIKCHLDPLVALLEDINNCHLNS